MKRYSKLLAVAAVAALGQLAIAMPAHASTQTVGFRAGEFHCPRGIYDIVAVDVLGTSSAPYINGTWRGHAYTASVAVTGVPAGGGQAQVTVTYRCKTAPFNWPGPGEPAYGTRWIYGTPPQPTYTL